MFPTLGYAAAPFKSAATGGLVAVFGAVVVAAALLFAPSHHPAQGAWGG